MDSSTPLHILKQYWGYQHFRPLQEEIIQSVLSGQDTLALLPTGGGKSICFQVPALARPGITIVVSPLIALMKDQVENLNQVGIKAVAIYSGVPAHDIDRLLDNCIYGDIKLLYLSPERLLTPLLVERIKKMKVNLLAVDEAHCISQWGYDFRPSYLKIADIREFLPENTPVLALTATATSRVVDDIQDRLGFRKKNLFQGSFARENLSYSVLHEENKKLKLLDILQNVPGTGIVYVRNRKLTKFYAEFLRSHRISAEFYHAGLTIDQRHQRQERWKSGRTRVMVSTNAFGMGIDKPDVRLVVHLDLPDGLEAYYQEAGRAGRDGIKSYAVLLYANEDKINLEYFHDLAFPDMTTIRQVYRALASYYQLASGTPEGRSFAFDFVDFVKNYKLNAVKTMFVIKLLEQEGWIAMTESFYLPSSMMFLMERTDVYEFQLAHPNVEPLIKVLLRIGEGAFLHYINLTESSIANYLKIPIEKLNRHLKFLHQSGVIDYREQTDSPRITFTKERVNADELTINREDFNFRKNRAYDRIKASINYAETMICRSINLLAYFGEETEVPCGECDVCKGRHAVNLSNDEYARYQQKIKKILAEGELDIKNLMKNFSYRHHLKVQKALEHMLDEGLVDMDEERLNLKV